MKLYKSRREKILFFLFLALIFLFGFNSAQAVAQINEEAILDENMGAGNSSNSNDSIMNKEIDVDDVIYGTYTEKIDSFNSEIKINKDSSIEVKETIVYNFGSLEKHGIYRNIPYKYKARGGNFKLRFSDIGVIDENGARYTFVTSKQGNNINIKIGDADKYVTGIKTYVISYKIARALNYFKDHDELYWNVTGNEWQIPISSSQVQVKFPESASQDKLQLKCYTGTLGSTAENCTKEVINDETVLYRTNGSLSYYEGLTIVFGWPKGVTVEPSLLQKMQWILADNWYLGLPILVFILSFLYWRSRGKDPKRSGTIIAEYEPPDKLTPAEVGTIYDNSADNKDVTATLINLAIRGYLKIKQTGEGNKDYRFIKLKEASDLENNFEKSLMDSIFGSGVEKNLDDLKNKFYKDLGKITDQIYEGVAKKGYYIQNPSKAKFGLLFWLAILSIIGSFILGGMTANFYLGASIFVSGVFMMIFSMLMARKTIKGTKTLEKILGFREFLQVTEKERLKFHNPPKMVPEIFEKFLPYAMVLGVENKWADNFKNIYNQEPSWYEGYSTHTFSAVILANSLSNFSSSSESVFVSQPRSSASGGGSGFSGGGSGGGFGGGGGGSW